MLQPGEVDAWTAAAADLGIAVEVGDDAVTVRGFGAQPGMLCAVRQTSEEVKDLQERAEAAGMGWSALGFAYDRYDRELFVDTLNDWGWTGDGNPPGWYSGDPWSD